MRDAIAPGTRIRKARLCDQAGVVALWKSCGMAASADEPDFDFEISLATPREVIMIAATRTNDVLGTAMAERTRRLGLLWYVAVAPGHRGAGLGRMLVQACEDWLQESRTLVVQLALGTGDSTALRFYERLGYELGHGRLMRKCLLPAGA